MVHSIFHSIFHSNRFALLLTLVLVVVAMASPCFAQESLQLLPPAAFDLVATDLQVPLTDSAAQQLERQPVSFSWPLEPTEQLDLVAKPHQSMSRSYHLEATAAELNTGVSLPTVSEGVYVHLSPMVEVESAALYAIDPLSLELQPAGPAKTVYDDGTGMQLLVDAAEMQAAGTPFPAGTSAFKVKPELGFGELRLRAPLLKASETRYRILVLERESTVTLGLMTEQDTYLAGQQLAAEALLQDGDQQLAVEQLSGFLRAPDGETTKLETARTPSGTLELKLPLASSGAKSTGLWEIEIEVSGRLGKLAVRRNVHTAFACTVPTARLTGLATAQQVKDGGLTAGLGIEVAAAGRYELRSVLYGTSAAGELLPIVYAESRTGAYAYRG